ncbi:MAG: hypothetical protein R8K47_01645 [Mariprofundaceae bacterium]
MKLNKDFRDMIAALDACGVEFVVIGAYAMGVFGYTRATGDLDIFVRPSQENAEKVMRALRMFGAPLEKVSVSDMAREGTVLQIGVAPIRIDVLTSIDGVSFEDITPEVHDLGGVAAPVIDFDALICNKRSTGRLRDLADCEELEKRRC